MGWFPLHSTDPRMQGWKQPYLVPFSWDLILLSSSLSFYWIRVQSKRHILGPAGRWFTLVCVLFSNFGTVSLTSLGLAPVPQPFVAESLGNSPIPASIIQTEVESIASETALYHLLDLAANNNRLPQPDILEVNSKCNWKSGGDSNVQPHALSDLSAQAHTHIHPGEVRQGQTWHILTEKTTSWEYTHA